MAAPSCLKNSLLSSFPYKISKTEKKKEEVEREKKATIDIT